MKRPICLAAALASLATLVATFGVTSPAASGAASPSASTTTSAAITAAQYAKRVDRIFARDAKQQAALGPGLLNADLVTLGHLARAAAYLDKIVAITNTEARGLAGLPRTKNGMRQRKAFLDALRKVLADERAAAGAAHRGNLAGFRTAFNRFIQHGRPTGPDYRSLLHALKATTKIFPLNLSSKRSTIYP